MSVHEKEKLLFSHDRKRQRHAFEATTTSSQVWGRVCGERGIFLETNAAFT